MAKGRHEWARRGKPPARITGKPMSILRGRGGDVLESAGRNGHGVEEYLKNRVIFPLLG